MTKEIQIRRKEPNSYLPAAVIAEAKRKLGSVFVNSAPLRGLNREEEEEYMPALIGISVRSADFDKKVLDYWKNFTVDVPTGGIVLNIGLSDNSKPINLTDWVKFRWIQHHPFVADRKSEMVGQKQFYIYDPAIETSRTNAKIGLKKAAYKEFIKISDKPDTMARVIRVLGKRNPVGMTSEEQENMLGQIIETDPEGFFKIATDKSLEIKDTILHLTELEILRKVGTSYLYHDTVIGSTMDEAILFMRNKSNSQAIVEMKAKLHELAPVAVITNKTPSVNRRVTQTEIKPTSANIDTSPPVVKGVTDAQIKTTKTKKDQTILKQIDKIDFAIGDAIDPLAELIPDKVETEPA